VISKRCERDKNDLRIIQNLQYSDLKIYECFKSMLPSNFLLLPYLIFFSVE
jgi:hypothetical protein